MSQDKTPLTRRAFLEMVGTVGGSAAVYEAMVILGLLDQPVWAGPPRLAAGMGEGKTVLILGAGIGGLTAAYELTRAGYTCEILEAQERAGGRSLTARRGTVITEESPEHGVTRQTCQFAGGLYLNMGPGRLPYHHRRVLHYCQVLKVPLEIYVMSTTANLFERQQAFDGQALVRRRLDTDARGYISELLAKAIREECLEQEVSGEDREKMLDLLRVFGDLNDRDEFVGSTRAGCRGPITVHHPCEPVVPMPLKTLLGSEFWRFHFYQPEEYEWQPTLFQPVGGMDRIVEGFKGQIGQLIRYATEVREIRLLEDGVEVTSFDRRRGHTATQRAHYCLSNIPLPVLQKIRLHNFSPRFEKAVAAGVFDPTCKVGWQANRRFWESDPSQIYGGISYIDDLITQMWYPSNGYFTANGTLTGAYNYEDQARSMGEMTLAERLVAARKGAIRLHPEFESDEIVPQKLGLSIAWQNVPFQRGGWANWKKGTEGDYARLLAPDGNFHVLGDQVSTLPGWQEGAMMSAEHVVEQVAGIRPLTVPEILRLPETRRLVRGRF